MPAVEKITFNHAELLRFIAAGSVDDGKSTLIGRLLHDSKAIFEDQLSALEHTTRRRGLNGIDLSLLTDGLQAEREQGITIDVAYRYFATPKRKFIIADTPGHEQYTRNMVTGASTANLAIILVDARKGVLTQSRRHAFIASLLGIPHIILAVNKMDLVGYSEQVFNAIREEFGAFAARLAVRDVIAIPMSALHGDMVVERGDNLSWYRGATLMDVLENIEISHDLNDRDLRFPVQWVCRPAGSTVRQAHGSPSDCHDFRGYAGRIESGSVKAGDPITVLPGGFTSRVKEIYAGGKKLAEAVAPQSITLALEDHIDISRGDMIVHRYDLNQGALPQEHAPRLEKQFEAMLCWMGNAPLDTRRKYLIKHTTKSVKAMVSELGYKVDINTLDRITTAKELAMNDIGEVSIKVQQPLAFDSYATNRATGSFIVIDEASNNTVAAGMII